MWDNGNGREGRRKQIRKTRLEQFNNKYKGNYTDLEVVGYRGEFSSTPRQKRGTYNSFAEMGITKEDIFKAKKAREKYHEEMSSENTGGVAHVLREKRKRLEKQRARIMNNGFEGGMQYRSKAHLAGFAVDNLLRTFNREGMMTSEATFEDAHYDQIEKLRESSEKRLKHLKKARY